MVNTFFINTNKMNNKISYIMLNDFYNPLITNNNQNNKNKVLK